MLKTRSEYISGMIKENILPELTISDTNIHHFLNNLSTLDIDFNISLFKGFRFDIVSLSSYPSSYPTLSNQIIYGVYFYRKHIEIYNGTSTPVAIRNPQYIVDYDKLKSYYLKCKSKKEYDLYAKKYWMSVSKK